MTIWAEIASSVHSFERGSPDAKLHSFSIMTSLFFPSVHTPAVLSVGVFMISSASLERSGVFPNR